MSVMRRSAVFAAGTLCISLYAAVLLSRFSSAGNVGFDYAFFVPRLFEGLLSFKAQGLWPPYYSAFLCGGYPLFADPQSMFYSLPQFLTFVTEPMLAVRITIVCMLFIGSLGAYALFRRVFGTGVWAAGVGALLFAGNGFFRSRMLIGHLGFHGFMLTPVLALALLAPGEGVLGPALLLSLSLAAIVHAGGHYVTFFALASCVLMALLKAALGQETSRLGARTFASRSAAGLLLAFMLCASKIAAAWSMMRAHPRNAAFDHAGSWGEWLRLLYVQFIDPLTPHPYHWGIWEYDCSLALTVWPGAALALWAGANAVRHAPQGRRARIAAGLAFAVGIYAVLALAAGEAFWLPWLKRLPLLRQMRANMRFSSVLILPLCTLAALGYSIFMARLSPRQARAAGAAIITVTLALTLAAVRHLDGTVETYLSFDASSVQPFYKRIAAAEPMPAPQRIAADATSDFSAMVNGEANPACYTAIWAHLPTEGLRPGAAVREVFDGRYNLVNPACYWFPRQNRCRPGTRIDAADGENFELLLSHKNPHWGMSALQRAAGWITVAGVAAWCVLFLGILGRRPVSQT